MAVGRIPRALREAVREPAGAAAVLYALVLDAALRGLAQASLASKRLLVEAVAACIVYDRRVTIVEAELLRAICDSLNCPMPPFRPQGAGSRGSLDTNGFEVQP